VSQGILAQRALKRAALLRKNALFYKNEHGAMVGEILLSLIETCRLNKVSVWKYLLVLMRERAQVRAAPSAYLPWNYARETEHSDDKLGEFGMWHLELEQEALQSFVVRLDLRRT